MKLRALFLVSSVYFAHPLPWISLIVAALGIFLAYAIYNAKWISAEKIGAMFKPVYRVFFRKYWLDELYEKVIVNLTLLGGLFSRFQWFDTKVVDGAVSGTAEATVGSGKAMRLTQTGQLQIYALTIGLGIVAIIICVLIFGS
jgi:NADH-quinone oxidoreductase subunit L